MSVRLALAKLCVCTCGGALIGGGAIQVADSKPSEVHNIAKKKHKTRAIAHRASILKVKRVRKVVRTTRTTTCVPTVLTVAGPALPLTAVPYTPPVPYEGSGSGSLPVVIGGSGGFGGGFIGGFAGGGAGAIPFLTR